MHPRLYPLRSRAASLVAFACLSLFLTAPLHAAPAAAKSTAYMEIVVEEDELPTLLTQADAGEASAQVKLGHYYMTHYEEGYANEQKAGDWFRRAAESGDADGQAWYAVYLWVKSANSLTRAADTRPWAEKAAEQGNTLGEYLMGKITPVEDRETAMDWYRRAARKGFMPAQRDLAFVLLWGNYFEDKSNPEVKEAHSLIAKAIRSGDPYALMMAGGHPRRSTMNTNEHKWEHPYKKSFKFVKAATTRAQQLPWRWYGTLFTTQESYGCCHGKGGAHYWIMTIAHVDLYGMYRGQKMEKKAEAVCKSLIATLKKRAKTDPVAANLALAELFQHWSTLYFHDIPCPEDYKVYAAKAAAATEDTHYDAPRLRRIAEGM